jgi:hypothetical protein
MTALEPRAMRTLLTGLFALLLFAATAQAQCMRINAEGQAAEGRLTTGNFRDAANRRESAFILQVAKPACLTGAEDPRDNHQNVRRIHLFSTKDDVRARISGFVGKTVRVRGSPFPAHTAHHHAPIVMDVSEIDTR